MLLVTKLKSNKIQPAVLAGMPFQGLSRLQLFRPLNSHINGGDLVTQEVYFQDTCKRPREEKSCATRV
jgi:hypothetical protein